MNWKLRLCNPATVVSLIISAGAVIYEILAICGITPWLTQDQFMNLVTEIVGLVFTVLVALGIVVDPTTAGVKDSELAMTYEQPYSDKYATQVIENVLNSESVDNSEDAQITPEDDPECPETSDTEEATSCLTEEQTEAIRALIKEAQNA